MTGHRGLGSRTGAPSLSDGPVFAPGRNFLGWDWRGLWVLDSTGGVVSPADRAVDPPGLYPSPHSPGERELWTGHQWTFAYPDRS